MKDREKHEREVLKRQREHIRKVVERAARENVQETIIRTGWKPCVHDACTSCHGTGVKTDGTRCVHMISCSCPKCSPYYMTSELPENPPQLPVAHSKSEFDGWGGP